MESVSGEIERKLGAVALHRWVQKITQLDVNPISIGTDTSIRKVKGSLEFREDVKFLLTRNGARGDFAGRR